MLKPLLIIGLGGSGGKTIRAMKQALNRQLDSARYTGGLPAAWQFLQIDTTYDGIDYPAPMLPQEEVHIVVPSGASFDEVLASITSKGPVPEQQRMLAGWGIPYSSITIKDGAGQTRAIGRQVGVADSAKTLQAIQNSIAKMKAPTAMSELANVATKLGLEAPVNEPQAFIISSIAGGSGAGMFMDVAELLKRATPENWGQDAISFLYTAEVFSSLGEAGANVSKNSLGAMNELIASKWVGISDRSDLLYEKLGLVSSNQIGKKGYGCKGNILVGSRNKTGTDISKGADGAGMNEVFLTIGEALAGAVSNDTVSEFLFQQAFVNITQTKSAIDVSGLAPGKPENPTMAAAGIGFGQMTLGADRIVEYVADALTKSQVEKLLWPDLSENIRKDGISTTDLIREEGEKIWTNFLHDAKLDEEGSSNQIVDELFPNQGQDRIKTFVRSMLESNIEEKNKKPVLLAAFSKGITTEWSSTLEDFLNSEKEIIRRQAESWVSDIQDGLRELVARELIHNGYAVVINLIDRLEVELRDVIIPDLLKDHTSDARKISTVNEQSLRNAITTLADGLTAVTRQNGAFLDKFNKELVTITGFYISSHVYALAASLVQDMLSFFVVPLKEQLANSRFKLMSTQRATILPNGTKNTYQDFPEWGSGIVPNRYKPRTIERILIDQSEYEATYELYAARNSKGTAPYEKSVGAALLGKKLDPPQGDLNPQSLITVGSRWITSVREARAKDDVAPVTRVSWTFNTDIEELAKRNRRWLKDEDSAFGKFTNKSIREYVTATGESPEIRDGRESKFVMEYEAMLGLAQPLILLNPNALPHILAASDGGNASGIMLKSSKIPFALTSNVGQRCSRTLQQNGNNPNDPSFEQKWFNAGSNDTTMFAAATTQASLPAWAFASLTEPILEQVAQSKNDGDLWIQFWEGRRSRPLLESIPFEAEIRRSIITGWLIAGFFGLRKIQTISSGRSLEIWNPSLQNPGWSTFPSPLLNTHIEDMNRETWLLPQLLVSAGIALAEFGKTGSPESINGYRLLKYLGREVTTTFNHRDTWDGNGAGDMLPTGVRGKSTFIQEWINSGITPAKNLDLSKALQARVSSNPNRGEALTSYLQQLSSEYKGIWDEFATSPWHALPETWELREDIDLALGDIANYISGLHITSANTSD